MSTPHVTGEFRSVFEAETGRLLRNRFLWFLGATAFIYFLFRSSLLFVYGASLLASQTRMVGEEAVEHALSEVRFGRVGIWLVLLLTIVDLCVMIWAGMRVWRPARNHESMGRERLFRFTQNFVIYIGLTNMLSAVIMNAIGFPWLIIAYHFIACAVLPWTVQQAIRPLLSLLVLNCLAVLIFSDAAPMTQAFIFIASLSACTPGLALTWFRHSRRMDSWRQRTMQMRYGQMRRELFDARRIHEALFPSQIPSGPLRFDFRYEPMLQIGGDYLYARPIRDEHGEIAGLNVLLLDVTGHGIAAALTVNRLYGEVERLYAENPDTGPGEVLSALNRYVHLTLAKHSVYVTALCLKVDLQPGPDGLGRVLFASGGHPPAFVCRVDGRIDELESTAIVLGACSAEDFDPCVQTYPFGPGDILLAYTDGALEARNAAGKMLGVRGLRSILAGLHSPARAGRSGLCPALLAAVDVHRRGPAEDDTLIVEIVRDLAAHPSTVPPAHNQQQSLATQISPQPTPQPTIQP